MLAYLKDILKIVLFFGVGFTILYFVYVSQNTAFQEQCALDGIPPESCSLLNKVWTDLLSVKWVWLLTVLLCFNISNISRALRWKMMLHSLNYKIRTPNAFFCIMLSYFANLGLPRAGEVVRATVFSRYEKIRIEKLLGTIVLDRILDLVSVLIILLLAIILEFDLIWGFISETLGSSDGNFPIWIWWFLGGFGVIVISLFIFRNKLIEYRIVQKFISLLLGFWEGLQSIRKIKTPLPFIFHSLIIWGMYFLMTYLCFYAFAPTAHLGLRAGLIVFIFGTFGVIIPSPGGMGTFHALAIIALAIYGISGDDAFSFANILFFTVQIGSSVLLGIISLIALPLYNKGYSPERPAVMQETN